MICEKCKIEFKQFVEINGKIRNLQRRRFCLTCSPFGERNNYDLTKPLRPKKDRDKEKRKRWEKKNPTFQRDKRNERKKKLVELKGGKCQRCGYNKCVAALTFHHRDPKEKKFALCSKYMLQSWSTILTEGNKCDLVCANCHAEIHHGIR